MEIDRLRPGTSFFGRHTGKNFNGDVFIVGGGCYETPLKWRNEIWLIPQDQCALGIDKCHVNATCTEEMVGYSCECNEGLIGDGFTCTDPPVSVPMSDSPSSSETPSTSPGSGPGAAPKQLTSTGAFSLASLVSVVASSLVALSS